MTTAVMRTTSAERNRGHTNLRNALVKQKRESETLSKSTRNAQTRIFFAITFNITQDYSRNEVRFDGLKMIICEDEFAFVSLNFT